MATGHGAGAVILVFGFAMFLFIFLFIKRYDTFARQCYIIKRSNENTIWN